MKSFDSSHIAFVPKGDSMWPFLKNKKQTVIIDKDVSQIKEFDVILYSRNNGDLILHRVIEVLDEQVVCSGDSQFEIERLSKSQIVGVMIGFYKREKYIEVSQKYRDKVKKYYKKNTRRKLKIKTFFFTKRLLNKIKRVFKGK